MAMRCRAHHPPNDPYFANVVTLHHFDVDPASNAATSYDVQGALWEFTPNTGGQGIVAGAAHFGAKGYKLTNSTGSTACGVLSGSTTVTPSWNVGNNDFTIELFIRPDTSSAGLSANYCGIVVNDDIGVTRGWLMYSDITTAFVNFAMFVGGSSYGVSDTSPPTSYVWTHYAAVREGGTLRLYRNGVQVALTAVSGTVNSPTMKMIGNLSVGGSSNNTAWPGALDELRITVGVCRYPGGTAFQPPSTAFPNQ